MRLDDSAILQVRCLGDHDHAVTDDMGWMLLGIRRGTMIDNPNVSADAGVLVNDGPFNHGMLAHTERGPAQTDVFGVAVAIFENVDSHDVAVSES